MVMSTCLPAQSDIQAASDLRAWSEEQLIAEAKTGKRAHFGELYERHVKRAFRVIHRIMRNREDMEDAVQDCLLNAFVHVKDFDALPPGSRASPSMRRWQNFVKTTGKERFP